LILKLFVAAGLLNFIFSTAQAAPSPYIMQRIISQGVPPDALLRLTTFMDNFREHSFIQSTYTCIDGDPLSVKPCDEPKRIPSTKTVTVGSPQLVAIIDYGAPSTDYRFFLINLYNGDVIRFYSSHGLGSGKSNFATKFSNIKDSKQTSLGIYLGGEIYLGRYGKTLRMYGLQGANDQSYNRDIVLHGAWYVGDEFINSIDPKTGMKYGRLGLSWGCPAVSPSVIQGLIANLSNGGLIMHYHQLLMDEAMTGREVVAPNIDTTF
jgi:hypothetical protein